jgi:decaprenylphospho-beta-D-ribofuranose 2-oxidase
MDKTSKKIANWSNYPVATCDFHTVKSTAEIPEVVAANDKVIARGNGRTYGDASLAENIVSTLQCKSILNFSEETETITCETGILLKDIIEFVLPKGFFPKILPGTKLLSLGGAIAADVHGKNHERWGSMANCTVSFQLLKSNGEIITCSEEENPDWYWATFGAQGLTGIILQATIKLRKIDNHYVKVTETLLSTSEQMFQCFENANTEYRIAWINDIKNGNEISGIFTASDHLKSEEEGDFALTDKPAKRKNVPFFMPSFVVNKYTIQKFNKGRIKKASFTTFAKHYENVFFPLDSISNWNKAYGKNGFLQYQVLLPEDQAKVLPEVIEKISNSQFNPFLMVIKKFAHQNQQSPLSFPFPGYTLAVDFKMHSKLFSFFEELDQWALTHGGRSYLAKDARLSASTFKQMYPQLGQLQQLISEEDKFQSLLSKRLNIK